MAGAILLQVIGWTSADDREQWFGGVVRARQYAQAMIIQLQADV